MIQLWIRDYINKDSANQWNKLLADNTSAERILGEKQYELTNHLGNVQVTVSDKRHEAVLSGREALDYRAALPAVYDYYPYGMPIKERTVRDTSAHTTYAMQMVTTPTVLSVANAFSSGVSSALGATLYTGTSFMGGITATGQTGEMKKVITGLTPGATVTMSVNLLYLGSQISIQVTDGNTAGGDPPYLIEQPEKSILEKVGG